MAARSPAPSLCRRCWRRSGGTAEGVRRDVRVRRLRWFVLTLSPPGLRMAQERPRAALRQFPASVAAGDGGGARLVAGSGSPQPRRGSSPCQPGLTDEPRHLRASVSAVVVERDRPASCAAPSRVIGCIRHYRGVAVAKKLSCWVGRHTWTTRVEQGEAHRVCSKCGGTPRRGTTSRKRTGLSRCRNITYPRRNRIAVGVATTIAL